MDDELLNKLKFGRDGLIPAVILDRATGSVLTVAYMNRESLKITVDEGRTCFWSRSRQELWRKGQTSGAIQRVASITADCDYDALVVLVDKDGPACHTGADSCFHNEIYSSEKNRSGDLTQSNNNNPGGEQDMDSLDDKTKAERDSRGVIEDLYEVIKSRKRDLPDGSYTTYLFTKGIEKILKKVGEEASEVIIAAMKRDIKETSYELADLCYHALVLMCELGIKPEDIAAELESRRRETSK